MSGLQSALVLGGALRYRPDIAEATDRYPHIGMLEVLRGESLGAVLRIQSSDPDELARLARALDNTADRLRAAVDASAVSR